MLIFCVLFRNSMAQLDQNYLPMIGAQVFIEPGQSNDQINHWFKVLHDQGMRVCRIRMFESYMHRLDGSWDFSLFDQAFNAARKYNIKVFATLFPATSFADVGGFKFPRDDEHLEEIADYIRNLVTHYKTFPALYGWVLLNEPGTGGHLPDTEYTRKRFEEWKIAHPSPNFNAQGYPIVNFAEERFLLDYTTWFLGWIAAEIHQYDPGRPLHVNNHQIFQNVAEYNFTDWRKFLSSLGASAHPSWHFGYFNRSQYTVALAANCDIIRSGAGSLPFWITELQGGNNIYSGFNPMCPTKEEITQWLWTGIGSGAEGIIFWCLNPRSSGTEAGEWALLNFQDEPSDRLIAASDVIHTIDNNASIFRTAKPVDSKINILYVREALWIEKKSQTGGTHYEGRDVGGVMKSALAYYEALGELGVASNFKAIDEFDWNKDNYFGTTIILAHQISIPSDYWEKLDNFVNKGGKLIADGLTAFFDEHMHNIMKTGFPFENIFGGNIKEFKLVDNLFYLQLNDPTCTLPAHLWRGTISPGTGKPLGMSDGEIVGVRNQYGQGEVVWIPSLLGLGARLKDYAAFSGWLEQEVAQSIKTMPFKFKSPQQGMFMKVLQSGDEYVTVLINKSKAFKSIDLDKKANLKPTILFAGKNGGVDNRNMVTISPEESIIILWK